MWKRMVEWGAVHTKVGEAKMRIVERVGNEVNYVIPKVWVHFVFSSMTLISTIISSYLHDVNLLSDSFLFVYLFPWLQSPFDLHSYAKTSKPHLWLLNSIPTWGPKHGSGISSYIKTVASMALVYTHDDKKTEYTSMEFYYKPISFHLMSMMA